MTCGAFVSPYLSGQSLSSWRGWPGSLSHRRRAMKKVLLPALLIAAATVTAVTPASANWFNNPYLGISRNVGSAPNPTPDDVRQMRLPIVVRQDNNRPGLFERSRTMFRGAR